MGLEVEGDAQREGLVWGCQRSTATVSGMDAARIGDLCRFENGSVGLVLALEKQTTKVALLDLPTGQTSIPPDSHVELDSSPTEESRAEVGGEYLVQAVAGKLIDPLGRPWPPGTSEADVLPHAAPTLLRGLTSRSSPSSLLMRRKAEAAEPGQIVSTGVAAIDGLRPLVRGGCLSLQAPTATDAWDLAVSVARNWSQQGQGRPRRVVAATVGRSPPRSARIAQKLGLAPSEGVNGPEEITLVAAPEGCLPVLAAAAPHAAAAVAEAAARQGEDVLLVLDGFDEAVSAAVDVLVQAELLPKKRSQDTEAAVLRSMVARFMDQGAVLRNGGSLTLITVTSTGAAGGDISAAAAAPGAVEKEGVPDTVLALADTSLVLGAATQRTQQLLLRHEGALDLTLDWTATDLAHGGEKTS